MWRFAVVEPQHPAQVFSLFAADHTFRLADEAVTGGVADFDTEILWLATLAQDAVAVNPVVFNIVDIVSYQE
jgi:hypothetical protein